MIIREREDDINDIRVSSRPTAGNNYSWRARFSSIACTCVFWCNANVNRCADMRRKTGAEAAKDGQAVKIQVRPLSILQRN